MYTLFDIKTDLPVDRKKIVEFDNVKKVLLDQVQTVKDYHRFTHLHIPSNHLLIRLLHMTNVSLSRESYNYVAMARDRTAKLAKHFKLIHSTNTDADIYTGQFYSEHVDEYIILHDAMFDVEHAIKYWQSLSPVKIHYHPFNDMGIGVPNGRYKAPTKGFAVISINLPLLALQYRQWIIKTQMNAEVKSNTETYIHQFVMANMAMRHTEIAMINRTVDTALGDRALEPFIRHNPVYVADYTDKVDKVIAKRLEHLSKKKHDFKEFVSAFEMLRFIHWGQIINLPDMARTRHVKWVYLLTYCRFLRFYLTHVKELDVRLSKRLINDIQRQLKYLSNANALPMHLPSALGNDLEQTKLLLSSIQA